MTGAERGAVDCGDFAFNSDNVGLPSTVREAFSSITLCIIFDS
jgi:hypothetical protein